MKLIFCMQIRKHQTSLQVDFSTLGIKASYNVILSLLMGWSSILKVVKVISLQYLKKEFSDWDHFLQVDKKVDIIAFDRSG